MLIQDIAGGSLINAPLPGDLESEEIGALVKKYMRGVDWADGEYRTRLLYGARDIVADTYAGHWQVAGLHGSGGPYAQRLVARKQYPIEAAKQRALSAIGLTAAEPGV